MRRCAVRLFFFATCLVSPVSRSAAEPPMLVACDELPAPVAALGPKADLEAFAVAPEASVAIASHPLAGDASRSVLRFTRGEAPPKDVKLAGRVVGLAATKDGNAAYAIVKVTDRKGGARNVDLVRLDLASGRTNVAATLPVTAKGLALGSADSVLWVASRDEIRTFQLPTVSSGPLYRALGENVGVAPLLGSSAVYLAQPSRVVLVNLAASQTRDGLTLSEEAAAPAPLTGMLASTGDLGPIALSAGGGSFCVRNGALPPPPAEAPPPPPAEAPPPAPPKEGEAAVAAAPVAAATAAAASDTTPLAVVPTDTPAVVAPENVAVAPVAAETVPTGPGVASGTIAGPSAAMVEAVVLLGPDNILHEAGRAIPDDRGRFAFHALAPGTYRIIAAGKGGRVLICEPPFITIRVSSNGAVEASVLNVVRAQ